MSGGEIGETYNIGGNCEKDNLSLVKLICSIMDEKRPRVSGKKHADLISFVTDRPGHDWRYAIDNSKIKEKLGWEPAHNINDGLIATVNFYIHEFD